MAININSNMSLGAALFLDARESVPTLTDLLAINPNIIPDGFECYVEDLDTRYKFNRTYNELFTGQWKEVKPEAPGYIGNAKTEAPTDFPANPRVNDWVLVENCDVTAPGQAGIAVYDGTGWAVTPIPVGDFVFPEPSDDGRMYFRTRAVGDTSGLWAPFTSADGKTIEICLNSKDSSTEGTYVPKAQELVWDTNRQILVIGDGTTILGSLRAFYEASITATDIITALGYTPEDVSQKAQPNGYAPLDASGKVPDAHLPASLTDTYSKTEIDNKDAAVQAAVTTLINNEATTARAAENALNTSLNSHITDTAIHVTQTQKDDWDAKVDPSALTTYDNHLSDTVIHVTQADKDKWNGMNKAHFVMSTSDLPLTGNSIGNLGYVQISAAGVTPIVCDTYIWDGTQWQLLDVEQVSMQFNWGNLVDKPTATVGAIDNAVQVAHSHPNYLVLNKIGQSAAGNFTYDGIEIGTKAIFLEVEALLPTTGEDNTLYIVYADSRVRGYPSISVWKDGAFQILGRGTQDAAPAVGDMSILQAEFFSVAANSNFIINVRPNQFFAFMPLEILKEIEGLKDQVGNITKFDDPSHFDYNENLLEVSALNKVRISLAEMPTILESVGDAYYSYVDVDLTDYKDIDSIQ